MQLECVITARTAGAGDADGRAGLALGGARACHAPASPHSVVHVMVRENTVCCMMMIKTMTTLLMMGCSAIQSLPSLPPCPPKHGRLERLLRAFFRGGSGCRPCTHTHIDGGDAAGEGVGKRGACGAKRARAGLGLGLRVRVGRCRRPGVGAGLGRQRIAHPQMQSCNHAKHAASQWPLHFLQCALPCAWDLRCM